MADLALQWLADHADCDLIAVTNDLAIDQTPLTAVLLSLLLDARAEDEEVDPQDLYRGGHWADALADAQSRAGSRLWLWQRRQITAQSAAEIEEDVANALQWMVDDGLADGVDVSVETTGNAAKIRIELSGVSAQPGEYRFVPVAVRELDNASGVAVRGLDGVDLIEVTW